MTSESILENLSIHNDNLSIYYIGSVAVTVLLVVITWYVHRSFTTNTHNINSNLNTTEDEVEGDTSVEKKNQHRGEINENVKSHIKTVRHILTEEVAANLSEQQLKEEKEVEKQQLEAIFQLLQNQQEKYQVSSMEELEDQLKLYR